MSAKPTAGNLYAIEAEINRLTAQQRHAARQARSKPLLDGLQDRMLAQRRRLTLTLQAIPA